MRERAASGWSRGGLPAACGLALLISAARATAASYYLDAVLGDDSNSGTSTSAPWKSLSKVNAPAQKFSAGDTINFQSAQTFSGGPLQVNHSGSATGGRITYQTYGGTEPATIQTASTTGEGVVIAGQSYITLAHLIVTSAWDFTNGATTATGHGISVSGQTSNITIDGVEVTRFGGRGISFESNGMSAGDRVVHCHVHHVGNAGIRFVGNWNSTARSLNFSHVYVGYSVVSDTKGGHDGALKPSGIELSEVDEGLIEYCEASRTGTTWNLNAGGPVGIWCWDSDRITIQYCYAHDNQNAQAPYDGGGFDLDGGSTHCVVQYCYSHNNDGPGQFVAHFDGSHPTAHNTIRYNISQNDATATTQGALNIWGASTDNFIYNNVIYGDKKLFVRESGGARTQVYNNVFVASGTNPVLTSAATADITYRHNCWWAANGRPRFAWGGVTCTGLSDWRAAAGQEIDRGVPTGMQADPQFLHPGGGPTSGLDVQRLASVIAYQLRSTSPLIHRAAELGPLFGAGHPGARDYYGVALPQDGACDIGASEYDSALPP